MEGPADPLADASEARTLEFTPSELALLEKACRMYRRRLPAYLRSAQDEVALLDGILKRIS